MATPHSLIKAFNSAACLFFDTQNFSRQNSTPTSLHWLLLNKRSTFKFSLLCSTFKTVFRLITQPALASYHHEKDSSTYSSFHNFFKQPHLNQVCTLLLRFLPVEHLPSDPVSLTASLLSSKLSKLILINRSLRELPNNLPPAPCNRLDFFRWFNPNSLKYPRDIALALCQPDHTSFVVVNLHSIFMSLYSI